MSDMTFRRVRAVALLALAIANLAAVSYQRHEHAKMIAQLRALQP